MTDIIKVLPDHIANQIAAGEVINRPANAVKELMENAVDASATNIKVIIRSGGKELIRVIDNGIGMSQQDARNSFLRHATSKISSAEDLFRLHTKGFRGEALASIAAVAQVEMITRRKEDELGTKILIEGTQYIGTEEVASAVGTSVAVKNLFYNIPARRNFLKADTAEMSRIVDEFVRVALAHPEISFQLFRGEDSVYNLPSSSLRRRIVGLFRSNTDNKLVPIEEKTPDVSIYGFVYKPEYAKMKGADQFIFVNNRYVKSSYLSSAVLSAFQGLIPDRHYPGYFLYFDIDPSKIDINISPTKTEISFDDERTIYSFLRATIRHSLGKYNVLPSLDFTEDQEINQILDHPKEGLEMPKITFDPNYNPFEDSPKSSSSPRISHATQNDTPWEILINDMGGKKEVVVNDSCQGVLFEKTTDSPSLDTAKSFDSQNRYTLINGRYILSHIKTGIMLIDPLRAHWRILYEKMCHNISSRGSLSQQILFSVKLDLDAWQMLIFHEIEEELSILGFQFGSDEKGKITVLGVPVGVKESEVQSFIDRMIDDYKIGNPSTKEEMEENIAKSLSYSMSIKNATTLSLAEMQNIATDLFECTNPSIAPNGKPTFVKIGIDELEKKFN